MACKCQAAPDMAMKFNGYYIVSKGVFEIVQIGRYKCITKDSFHSWYASQSRYTILASAAVQERSE